MKKSIDIKQIINEISDEWLNIEGVEGIGQGKKNDEDCILVMISSKSKEISDKIPSMYKGFPIQIIETGKITQMHSI